ncbi:MAG: sensor domain-containing diguanylate cyclase [Synergistota bacterium]|nr:sensor domain-containing diguanylate cyclase [Synergistota bacterium]
MKDRYKIFFFITAVISALAVLIIYVAFDKYFNEVYKQNAELSILESKKDFLKFTVDNQIIRIEEEIAYEESLLEDLKNEISLTLDALPPANSTELINFCRRYTEKRVNNGVWTFVVWDKKTSKLLYDPAELIKGNNASAEIEKSRGMFAVYGIKEFGGSTLFYGVKHDVIDQKVKKKIAAEIHNSKFPLDSYIWVNEIVNYEGGDDYAIRRVHPNLKETEGMYLSTEMKDIKGATPYLTELEGVKKDGEIFFSYHFKKKTEDRIAEKLTYAKLYKRYDWIIAFGMHLEDMAKYAQRTEEASKGIIVKLALVLAALIALLMFVSHAIIVYLENRYHQQRKKEFEDEISKDITTGALTRRSADKFLEADFENFRRSGSETAFIMMDMDNLKTINDTYGHDAGDAMLKNTVDIIKGQIRQSDLIFRWGGDEFVVVCQGLRAENVVFICEKWAQAVKDSEIEHEGKMISTTISVGISYFRDDDKESSDVIDRADEAMYRAKRGGRDRVELAL